MFGVVWTDPAMDDLADIWVTTAAENRARVERPRVRRIRGGRVRIGFTSPLVIFFMFEESTQTSVISHVRRYGRT